MHAPLQYPVQHKFKILTSFSSTRSTYALNNWIISKENLTVVPKWRIDWLVCYGLAMVASSFPLCSINYFINFLLNSLLIDAIHHILRGVFVPCNVWIQIFVKASSSIHYIHQKCTLTLTTKSLFLQTGGHSLLLCILVLWFAASIYFSKWNTHRLQRSISVCIVGSTVNYIGFYYTRLHLCCNVKYTDYCGSQLT